MPVLHLKRCTKGGIIKDSVRNSLERGVENLSRTTAIFRAITTLDSLPTDIVQEVRLGAPANEVFDFPSGVALAHYGNISIITIPAAKSERGNQEIYEQSMFIMNDFALRDTIVFDFNSERIELRLLGELYSFQQVSSQQVFVALNKRDKIEPKLLSQILKKFDVLTNRSAE